MHLLGFLPRGRPLTGIGLSRWLGTCLHLHGLPPFAMTLTGLVDTAPLLWVGWTQRRRTQEARR